MARPPARLVGILGAVTALVPLSIDMYLPVRRLHDGTAVPMAAVMAGCGVLALGFHRALVGGRPARRMA